MTLRLLVVTSLMSLAAMSASALVRFDTTQIEEELFGSDNPQALAIADVDGDGVGDVIGVEPESDSVVVLLNDGSGELDFGEFFDTLGAGPVAVAAARFNADEFVDLVTVNAIDGTISVLLNDSEGQGFFDEDDPRQFQVAANPRGVAVGDFNGDSVNDLAVLSPGSIYLLQGNGDGTFNAFNPATVSTRSADSFALAIGQLDANPTLDLAVTNRGNGQAATFLGNGDGTFNFNGLVNVGNAPTGLVIADADGDGDNDLIIADSEAIVLDEVRLLRNEGNAIFSSAESVTSQESPSAITAFDVEPDGKVDLALTTSLSDQMAVLCQLSDKCNPIGDFPLEAGIWRSPIAGTIPGCTVDGQVAITSGKLNADDMDDLVALQGDLSTLCVMVNQSEISATPTPTGGPSPTPTQFQVGHIGDDGCAITGKPERGWVALWLPTVFLPFAIRARRRAAAQDRFSHRQRRSF